MCGIAGVFGSRLAPAELERALERMASAMRNRGPDQENVVTFPELGAGLAVRRLALVDLDGGDQPATNEDSTVLALLNGEIYNHVALRRELEGLGHRFRTRCDTEVLAHLYEQEGERFLARLEGMFALAILDLGRRRLLLARDGPGMKPLYYAPVAGGFAFASEVKALFAAKLVEARPDPAALDIYLGAGFVPAPRTAFAGVEKLVAGSFLVIDDAGARTGSFWRFGYDSDAPQRTDRDYVDELERRLDAAVGSHLAADVPIGALLSGGWDSSLVATFAARRLGTPLQTFSLVFPENPDADESRHSRRMAEWLGAEHREIEYRPAMLPDLLPRLVRLMDEPVVASPLALTWCLASLAGAHVKGVLGGEGADELFGGYRYFRRPYPYWLRRVLPKAMARFGAERAVDPRVRRWMRIAAAPTERAADAEWTRFLTPDDKRSLLRPELRAGGPDLAPVLISDELEASCRDHVQRRLAYDIRGRLADAILLKYDKLGMNHALEARLPFLDRGVIELAERLPSHLKVRRGREKIVVAELARRHLPPEIAARRKQALAYPRGSWAKSPAGERLRSMLLDGAGNGPFLREPLERFLSMRPTPLRDDRPFAALVTLQVWWNEFF